MYDFLYDEFGLVQHEEMVVAVLFGVGQVDSVGVGCAVAHLFMC